MQYSIELNEKLEIFDLDKIARQAAGAVWMRVGGTVMLATVAREERVVEEDFLPLTVQYVEKAYAAGRIPGGYIKRETKPGEAETLTARIIDRSLRPLFPKGYAYPTQIVVLVLSADEDTDLQVMALNAASVALYLSDIPIKAPVCGVRVGRVEGEFVLNPTAQTLKNSSLDLYVAGVGEELLMIEMRSLPSQTEDLIGVEFGVASASQMMNELGDEELMAALALAGKAIANGTAAYAEAFSKHRKEAWLELKSQEEDAGLGEFVEKNYEGQIKTAINKMAKSERAGELEKIAKLIAADPQSGEDCEEKILKVLDKVKKKLVRAQILNEGKRADGRGLDELREISIETNVLPNAHGSCLFTRGQTQALVVATLGSDEDAQRSEGLGASQDERFMLNYNFPGFCVGEASPLRAPGRRELGHGNLAKRALYPSVDENYPYVIRLVSEILESNGSSSMASVCGGSLALRAAGVPSIKLVAGVAMGLVCEGERTAILTDIMGLEDHDGDMDFKVAGTSEGITALQMDIKLGGLAPSTLQRALAQAGGARSQILAKMEAAAGEIVVNEKVLPRLELFNIDPSKIVDIIGQAGKTIKEIIEKFGVSIDLDREKGGVKILGKEGVSAAKDYIIKITSRPGREGRGEGGREGRGPRDLSSFRVGLEFEGLVKSITSFGAFITLRDGVDGLLHISKIRHLHLSEGQTLRVVIREIKDGKISLGLGE